MGVIVTITPTCPRCRQRPEHSHDSAPMGCPGLSARIGADHLGHAKVSMTQDRYVSRGRVHNQVADLLDRAVSDINDE